jgi:TIR domain
VPIPSARNLDRWQRAALAKAVTAALIRRDWNEIEAMLGGLKLPVPERDYRLGRESAATGALSRANDDQLDIVAGLVLPTTFNLDWEQFNPWEPGRFRLFLSHAHQDREFVSAVAQGLNTKGIHGFVAHQDIDVQAEWAYVIEYALDTADALVAFTSEHSLTSPWCNQEIGWALGRDLLVVSVALGRAPTGFTSRFQAQKTTDDPQQLAGNLWNFLLGRKETGVTLSKAVINYLEASDNWEDATPRSAMLSSLQWTADTVSQLAEAVRSSRKLTEAYRVSGRVRQVFTGSGYQPDEEVGEYLQQGKR